jgi:hypothetical protein
MCPQHIHKPRHTIILRDNVKIVRKGSLLKVGDYHFNIPKCVSIIEYDDDEFTGICETLEQHQYYFFQNTQKGNIIKEFLLKQCEECGITPGTFDKCEMVEIVEMYVYYMDKSVTVCYDDQFCDITELGAFNINDHEFECEECPTLEEIIDLIKKKDVELYCYQDDDFDFKPASCSTKGGQRPSHCDFKPRSCST